MLLELGLHLRAPSCVTRNPSLFAYQPANTACIYVCTFICKVLLVLKGGESLGELLRPIGCEHLHEVCCEERGILVLWREQILWKCFCFEMSG